MMMVLVKTIMMMVSIMIACFILDDDACEDIDDDGVDNDSVFTL